MSEETEPRSRRHRDRAATAERTNADRRWHRGLDFMNVRGWAKVASVLLQAALTFNSLRMGSVRPSPTRRRHRR